jgi:hypothetical protein
LRQPRPYHFDYVLFLFAFKLAAFLNRVPLLKAASATGRRRVLRYEYRMITQWGLLPVVKRVRRSQPLLYEICCVK